MKSKKPSKKNTGKTVVMVAVGKMKPKKPVKKKK